MPEAPAAGRRRVLVAGVSARAVVESAVRAGFEATGLDAFGDAVPGATAAAMLSLPRDFGRPFTPHAAARVARQLAADAVVYLSSFENHPRSVALLARGRPLWGNPPDVLRRVRDPRAVARVWREHGVAAPAVCLDAPGDACGDDGWLLKPVSSGGGRRVRPWRPARRSGTRPVPRGCYLQARLPGTPASVVFVAAGGRAVVLGVSRQIVGDARFGASGFRYCGNILARPDDPQFADGPRLVARAVGLASTAAEAFGLVGINGVDLVAVNGVPHPIEVNPRWPASVELAERVAGAPLFGLHAAACADGVLPAIVSLPSLPQAPAAVGKAIVFARHDATLGDTRGWAEDPDLRDVPRSGEVVRAGGAVCTVFASGEDAAACEAALAARAAGIYGQLARWEREAA